MVEIFCWFGEKWRLVVSGRPLFNKSPYIFEKQQHKTVMNYLRSLISSKTNETTNANAPTKKTKPENKALVGPKRTYPLSLIIAYFYRFSTSSNTQLQSPLYLELPKDLLFLIIQFTPPFQSWKSTPEDGSTFCTVQWISESKGESLRDIQLAQN